MKIRTEADFLSTKWSGGTTTQLFISPEGASLSEGNFDWRISSAFVEAETSDFTVFDGYERILIPLKGKLAMEHQTPNGVIHQNVSEFELARFSGSWPTKAKGKLTDFNLIFKPNYHPKVHVTHFPEEMAFDIESTVTILFVQQGICNIDGREIHAPALVVNDQHRELKMACAAGSGIISVEMDLVG